MGLVDFGAVRRSEALHAIAASREKDGAKDVDKDVQNNVELPRLLARSLEEGSPVVGLTVSAVFVSLFQRARPDGDAEVDEQHDGRCAGSVNETQSPSRRDLSPFGALFELRILEERLSLDLAVP